MKIAVLTSGGVDSSVALKLLKDQGHDVTAFYLKIWLEDELSFLGSCPWEEDLQYVKKICESLNVPLEIRSMQKEYWDTIVKYTLAEIEAGRTPNPDVLCNQRIKFGFFLDSIDESFEKVATGHYARTEIKKGVTYLKKAPDPIKDQTYFLGYLNQKQVSRALFPIGHLHKSEVRKLAKQFKLPNQDRKDSQGICFLGKIRFRDFVKYHLGIKRGDIIEYETNKKIGEHSGVFYYTIGQRKGILLHGGPWYVVKKDLTNNILYISHRYTESEIKVRDEFEIHSLHWISGKQPKKKKLHVKIRHAPLSYECTLTLLDKNTARVKFIDDKDQGIASGQFAIFYDGEACLGGGVIQ